MGAAFDYEEPASVCTSRATPIPPKMVAARLLAVPLIPDHDVTGYVDAQANPAPVSAGSSQRPLIPPSPARLLHPHLRRPRPPKDTMAHRRVRSMSRLSRWSAKARCALQVVRMDARAMCLRELPPDRAARTMLLRLELFLFRMPSWCQVRSQRRAFRYGDVPLSWSGV
ncbi:unnamed protein product [Effrenium voratum]|nr:unnamed protein product [Effrenium voratum]